MPRHIHIHVHQAPTTDGGWSESQHPRESDGKFGSGGSSGKKASKPAAKSTAASRKKVEAHPNYSANDYEYLSEKGWSDQEILDRWDEEHKAGKGAQQGNKYKDPRIKANAEALRKTLGSK